MGSKSTVRKWIILLVALLIVVYAIVFGIRYRQMGDQSDYIIKDYDRYVYCYVSSIRSSPYIQDTEGRKHSLVVVRTLASNNERFAYITRKTTNSDYTLHVIGLKIQQRDIDIPGVVVDALSDPIVSFITENLVVISDMRPSNHSSSSLYVVNITNDERRVIEDVEAYMPRRPALFHYLVRRNGTVDISDSQLEDLQKITINNNNEFGGLLSIGNNDVLDIAPENAMAVYINNRKDVVICELTSGIITARLPDPGYGLSAIGVEIKPEIRQVWVRYRFHASLIITPPPSSRIIAYDYSGKELGIVTATAPYTWYSHDTVLMSSNEAMLVIEEDKKLRK